MIHKIILSSLLILLIDFYIILAVDMEIARRDYNNGIKVENCIFNYVCERYNK